jgi:hypothetical protein
MGYLSSASFLFFSLFFFFFFFFFAVILLSFFSLSNSIFQYYHIYSKQYLNASLVLHRPAARQYKRQELGA